jgi:hydrogenase maturation protease
MDSLREERGERARALAVSIVGLGNPFMGDDGVGVHILRRLRERAGDFPEADFIDGGTAPMKVLHAIARRDVAILIDCAYMGEAPGTIKRFLPSEVLSRKRLAGISVHEGDLLAILRMSRELGELPETTVIFAIEPAEIAAGDVLSPVLSSRLEEYVAAIAEEISALKTDTR